MEIYLVKEGCGTHVVYDMGEYERLKKFGWVDRPEDWLEQKKAAYKEARGAEIKAEMARLAAEASTLDEAPAVAPAVSEAPKKKPGRKPKVA
jgi:hypothetical protein